jgi:hypothetical protein
MLKRIMIAAAISLTIVGCKKDEQQQIVSNNSLYTAGGVIKGTVNGVRASGVPFNIPFEYNYYFEQDRLNLSESTGLYSTVLDRYPSGNPSQSGYASLDFSLYNTSTPFGLTENSFGCDVFSTLSTGEQFEFYTYFNNGGFTNSFYAITNFNFNASSRVASGNFSASVDGNDNSTGNTATITGSFQTSPLILTLQKPTSGNQSPVADVK